MLAIYKYIINILAIMILYYYAAVLYGVKSTRKRMLYFVVIIGSIISLLIFFEGYLGVAIRGFCVVITMILGIHLILELNIIKSLLSCVIYSISLALGDTFAAFLLIKTYGYTAVLIKSSILLSFTSDLLIYGSSVIIIIIIMMVTQPMDAPNKFSRKINLRTSAYMLFTLIVIAINNSLYMQYIHLISNKFVLVNILITWIYLILSLYINFTARDLAIKEQEYNEQQDYIRTIDNLINDYRRLKHNHANSIYSIYGYIQENDMDGLKLFFDEAMEDTKRISSNTLLALQKIKVYSVFGLFWAKVNKAETSGIRAEVIVSKEVNEINMKMSDLCEVLGNYLDNALEGATRSKDKRIKISIDEDEEFIKISISNSYDDELDINKIYNKGYSTKGENRGYGLAITEEILLKHKNVLHNINFEDNVFTQELCIKK